MSEPMSIEDLHNYITKYIKSRMDEDVNPDEWFINSWVLVINGGTFEEGMNHEYDYEGYPVKMAPHEIKGLLTEGIEMVLHDQNGDYDD